MLPPVSPRLRRPTHAPHRRETLPLISGYRGVTTLICDESRWRTNPLSPPNAQVRCNQNRRGSAFLQLYDLRAAQPAHRQARLEHLTPNEVLSHSASAQFDYRNACLVPFPIVPTEEFGRRHPGR